jgi:phosphohistidine phosphatase
MEIYILRHGIAVERGTRGYAKDGDRPLTKEGEEKMHQIAQIIEEMDLQIDLILSSPFVRAKQTAEIVAEALGEQVTYTDLLKPDSNPKELIAEINDEKPQRVMLVGHEPDLSQLVSLLTSGGGDAAIELKKGGLCKLTTERLTSGQCATLNWLLTPKQLRSML